MKPTVEIESGQAVMALTFPELLSKNQQALVASILRSACTERNISKPTTVLFRLRRELHLRVVKAWSDQEGSACLTTLSLTRTAEPMALQFCTDCLNAYKSTRKGGRKRW